MPGPRKDQSDQSDFSEEFAHLELGRAKPVGPQVGSIVAPPG